ncbi:MAG: Smr/MutS family protein [candidate division WOR-3 bacterium]
MGEEKNYKNFEELLNRYPVKNKDENYNDDKKTKTVDLHKHTKTQALEKVLIILKSAKKENLKKLKLICGKGKHSNDEPVIFESVKNFLKENQNYFKNYKIDQNNNITIYF